MKVTTMTLGQHEAIIINFEGTDTSVTINGNGNATRIDGIKVQEFNIFAQDSISPDVIQTGLARHEPTKLEKIERYLDLLYQAQRSEHDVHKEIDSALKQFREVAGIKE